MIVINRLFQRLDSEPLRQMALQALQDCVGEDRQQQQQQSLGRPSEVFSRMASNHRELTPNLLDSFISAIQLPTPSANDELDQDLEEMEGAAAHHHHHQEVYLLRNALTPFLFRRMSDVHDVVIETLVKLENSTAESTASASGREDELAEADQSCDQSCDGTANGDESSGPAVGLDEVPTRLMSVLQPPVWTSSPGRPAIGGPVSPNVLAMEESSNPRNTNDWFPPTSNGGV